MGNIINKVHIGNICDSEYNGKFIIESLVDSDCTLYGTKNEKLYYIKFLDTGFRTVATRNSIHNGKIKDYLKPSVANVGYIGSKMDVSTDRYIYMMYKPWNDMIHRCYDVNDGDYKYYGGIGIRVSERWFNFTTYLGDLPMLFGYESKLMYPSMYQLDKDYLQLNIPKSERIYSLRTCIFLSKYDNIMIMARENQESSCGYYGVLYKDHSWCCRINNVIYGRFTIPEAAANLYNYIYPAMHIPFNNISLLNDTVPFIPYHELHKYITKGKQRWLNDYPEME